MKRVTLFCCLSFLLLSCLQQNEKKVYRIAFSQCTGDDNWRRAMLADMKRELAFYDDLQLVYMDAKDNNYLQVNQVKELMKQDIDLLIISPNEAQPLTGVVEEAFNKGMPVIVVDRKTSSPLYTSYIGADNYEVGKMAGEYAAKRLKGKGSIIEVIGRPGSTPATARQKGFAESIAKHPDIQLKAEVYGNWLKADAKAALMKVKNRLPETDLIFAQNDVMALGSYEVCKSLNLAGKVKVIGVDGLPGSGLEFVSDRLIDATMLYPTGGEEAIKTAHNILTGESFLKENLLQTLVIDSTNATSLRLQAKKINEQQVDLEKQQTLIKKLKVIYRGQTTVLYSIVTALLLVLFLGLLALFAWRRNRKINRQLSASNNEIMLQRNQLIEMAAKVKEASEAKFNFFTNISHELRTPLALILGPLEDALSQPRLHLNLKNDLNLIQRNALRLLKLVNQLMEFRKIELDKMKLKASENDIAVFVKDITNAFNETARQKNITLTFTSSVSTLPVWFDADMLDKVLFNLLSNAFKFTQEGGFVTVSIGTSASAREAVVVVEDTGLGIAPEARAHVFEMFYQENGSRFKGSGLGLALSKEIIELHYGTIHLKSEKWKGTRFEICLPLGASHLKPEEVIKAAPQPVVSYDDIKVYTSDNAAQPVQLPAINLEQKEFSILIIEDSDDLRSFLRSRLLANFNIYEADKGRAGISMTFELVPDLIICDVALPDNTGFDVTSALKSDVRSSHIPIIILTASSSVEKQILSMKLNADAFISKPFNLQHLEETIKSLLKNRKILKDHFIGTSVQNGWASSSKKMDRKFVNEFMAIVEKNIDNDRFSVEDICTELQVSRMQLSRKVKALMDINVTDYILNTRLQKAKFLLLNEDLTIAEVAYKVGFASQAYFSTVFKSKLMVTPSEFKEKAKK